MARTRDVVIGVIIGASFLVFFVIMAVMILGSGFSDGIEYTGFGDKVAIVNVNGEILSSSDIVRQLDRWGDDNRIKAIVIRINSPGGGVAPSQEIYEKILKIKKESGLPVVVSMASVCASGGYMVACAADKIVANPGTLTGSIGVIVQWPIYGDLLDKVGISFETIKSGEVKDIGSPYREPTDADREVWQSVVDDAYQQFVQVLVGQRGLSTPEVLQIADGSIFSGRQAKDLGLVDQLGTYEDAVDLAGELAGLGDNPDTITEAERRRASIFDLVGSVLGVDLTGLSGGGESPVYPRLSYILK